MCQTIKKPPVLVLAINDGVNIHTDGRPQCIMDEISGTPLSINLEGGGFATFDMGATPGPLPASGWTLSAGSDSSYRGGRVYAEFSGPGLGSGAQGYFNINTASGVIGAPVITNPGTGHTGVITMRPRRTAERRVVFDLGKDWNQYREAILSWSAFTTDSVIRCVVGSSRERKDSADVLALIESSNNEAWLQPVFGGQPSRRVMFGGRFLHLRMVCGADVSVAANIHATILPT